MNDFTLPKEQQWFEETGRYDNIEIVDTDEDTIYCTVTDDETVLVADVSDSISDYRGHAHAWERYYTESGFLYYNTACRHMSSVPSTMIGENDSRHTLYDRVPCDSCKNALQ